MRTYGPLEVSGPTIYPNDMPERIIPRRNYIPYLATALAKEVIQQSHHIKLPNFDQSLPNISHSMYHDYAPAPGDTFFTLFSFLCSSLGISSSTCPARVRLTRKNNVLPQHSFTSVAYPAIHTSHACSHAPPSPKNIKIMAFVLLWGFTFLRTATVSRFLSP